MKKNKVILMIVILAILLAVFIIIYKKPLIVIAFIMALVLLINLLPFFIYKPPLTSLIQEKYNAIIILGYPATKDGMPSPIMRERVIKAVELFNEGYANYIICSGGNAHNKYVEADIMINLAMSLGIPHNCLIREGRSVNTYGNILNSVEIMKKKDWESAIVVTSPWHLRRASYLLSKFNIKYVMEKSYFPKEFPPFYIFLIYMFENYTMIKNKILFH